MRPPLRPSRRDLNSLFCLEPLLIGLGRPPPARSVPGGRGHLDRAPAPVARPSVPPSTCLALHLCSLLPSSLSPPSPASRSPSERLFISPRSLSSCPSDRPWAPSRALPPAAQLLGPATPPPLPGPQSRPSLPFRPLFPPAFNALSAAAMSNNMAKIAEARKAVEQLKLEVNIDRMKVRGLG